MHDAGPCVQNHAHSSTGSVDESGGGGTQLAEERAGAGAGACACAGAGAEEVLHDIARPFTAIAERLEQCGYAVDWKIIGSSKNVYIVGVRGDLDVECVRDYNPDEAAHCSFPPSWWTLPLSADGGGVGGSSSSSGGGGGSVAADGGDSEGEDVTNDPAAVASLIVANFLVVLGI